MTTRKLQGPLGGDYQTDGEGNAVLLNAYPLTQEDDVPLRLADHEARVTAAEAQLPLDPQQDRALALRRWFVALANRDSSPADIWTIADSILEGHNLSSYLNRIPATALTRLRSKFPTTGVAGGLGYIAAVMGTGQCADWPVANTGGGTADSGIGQRARIFTGSGNKSVFSFSGATSIGLRYNRNGSTGFTGTFSYKIDSGSATNVDTKTSTLKDFVETLVTIPDTDAHTITVEYVSGAAVLFDGFMHYNGDETKGIRMWEGGHGGFGTTDVLGNATDVTRLGDQAAAIQPALVVIELGANDFASAASRITPAQFSANLSTIISTVRASVTTPPSIVLVPVWELNPTGKIADWSEYVAVMRTIAANDAAICLLDFQARVKLAAGTDDDANGILRSDEGTYRAHPSNQGALYLGELLAQFLEP